MIDWLNDNSGAVQAISVIVLAVVTAVYAWRTWAISDATKKQAKASTHMADQTRELAEAARDQAIASARMADEARKEAEASRVMANEMEAARYAAVKPIIQLKVRRFANDPQPNADSQLRNVGVGPAINIEFDVSSGETTKIGVLGAGEETSSYHHIVLETVNGQNMAIVRYEDVFGNPWESQLGVVLDDPPRVGQLAIVEGSN